MLMMCVGLIVMALAYLLTARDTSGPRRWIGIALIASVAPVFFWLGAFSRQVDAGLCYTSAIQSIAAAVARTDHPQALARQIEALPQAGYETRCPEVRDAAAALPGAGAH